MKQAISRKTAYLAGQARRLTAALLALLLCALFCAPAARAAAGRTGALSWTLSGGTLTISGSGAMPEYTDAYMPPWSSVSEEINRIVVSEGVTSVGSLAFYNCTKVSSVSLPSTVVSIGDRAFKFCRSLTYLRFPSALTSIGEAAFESCESLNGVTLPSGLLSIGDYAFDRCVSLSLITIPASVTHLGSVVFHYCTGLTQAVILCPITKVPDWLFYGCTSLYSVSLPETVTEMGSNAFHDCDNLGGVYYSGVETAAVSQALQEEPATSETSVISGETVTQTNTGSVYITGESGSSTAVSSSDSSVITKTQTTSYEYTVNGEPATYEEVLEAGEEDQITAQGSSETTITAVIYESSGWDEVTRAAENAEEVKAPDSGNVEVSVQLEDSTVTNREMSKMAGDDVTLTITTGNGNTWIVDESDKDRGSFNQSTYDLDFTVTKLEENKTGIDSDTVYQVDFASDVDFDATVGVKLQVGNAYRYATLYERVGKQNVERQTVLVDTSGVAWFDVNDISKNSEYYVGINVKGVDTGKARIPDTMTDMYGIDSTLTDRAGMRYEVGERTSRWGITGARFALYVAIGIFAIVLIVTLIMVTMNKINQSKLRYAVSGLEDQPVDPIDEDALRIQIMQEMLEEQNRLRTDGDDKSFPSA